MKTRLSEKKAILSLLFLTASIACLVKAFLYNSSKPLPDTRFAFVVLGVACLRTAYLLFKKARQLA